MKTVIDGVSVGFEKELREYFTTRSGHLGFLRVVKNEREFFLSNIRKGEELRQTIIEKY